jgi:Protein of unknown function (DUF2924)
MLRSSFDREAIEAEIDRIRSLGVDELRSLWHATFRTAPPPGFTKDLIARFLCWHIQEQAFGGLDPKTARHLASLDGAIGQKQIAQGASSPAPYWCANTRASSTPSQSLRMALSGARPPMPASPPSRGPSPGRTGMDRASLASGSTRRRQCRRTEPMRRLHLPIGERLSRRPAASPAGGRQRSAKWERHSGASLA